MAPATISSSATQPSRVRFIHQTYDNSDSQNSALKLIHTLIPQWAEADAGNNIEFVRFTDGITNTLLKAVNRRPGLSQADIDREAVLLRAYGNGTDVLIDREREAANHELLMKHGLAPELLARFANGMLYRYISGSVAGPKDLADPQIAPAVARRLAEWHANVPCMPDTRGTISPALAKFVPGKLVPNVWTTMQKWILALPKDTEAQRERQDLLQREFEALAKQLSQRPGLGKNGLVFAHCDLLSANVIIHREGGDDPTVSFIDYEYGTPQGADSCRGPALEAMVDSMLLLVRIPVQPASHENEQCTPHRSQSALGRHTGASGTGSRLVQAMQLTRDAVAVGCTPLTPWQAGQDLREMEGDGLGAIGFWNSAFGGWRKDHIHAVFRHQLYSAHRVLRTIIT